MKIYIDKQWSYWEKQGVRGPKPTIGKFGNGTDIMDIQRGTITPQQWVEKYGKLSGAYFGLLPTLVVSDVEIVKEVTIKEGFGLVTFNSNSTFIPDVRSLTCSLTCSLTRSLNQAA